MLFRSARIHHAFQLLFARPARPEELKLAQRLLATTGDNDPAAAWRELAHVLLCSNEFVYLD